MRKADIYYRRGRQHVPLIRPDIQGGLALCFFHSAEFITQIADHGYGNDMNDKPSAVKKLQAFRQGHQKKIRMLEHCSTP